MLLYCLLAVGEVDVTEVLQTLYIFFPFFLELVVISSSRVLNFMMWFSIGFLSFSFWAAPHSLCNLSSPTRDRTWALSVEVWSPIQGLPPALVSLHHCPEWALSGWTLQSWNVWALVLKSFSWIFFDSFLSFSALLWTPKFSDVGLKLFCWISSAVSPFFCSVREVSSVFSSSLSYLIFNITVFVPVVFMFLECVVWTLPCTCSEDGRSFLWGWS